MRPKPSASWNPESVSLALTADRTMSKYTRHPTRARLWDAILERDMMLDDLMERTAAAVATGEPLMISQLSRQTRGRDSSR